MNALMTVSAVSLLIACIFVFAICSATILRDDELVEKLVLATLAVLGAGVGSLICAIIVKIWN